jgi:hypothetical protein
MTNRKGDVDVLLRRSENDFGTVRAAYDKCLHDRAISAELKIDIKNLCGNLRSILDYLARDIREKHYPTANPNARFYFPIFPDAVQYRSQMNNWFPGLQTVCPDLWNYLESVQPYQTTYAWLGKLNRINNENKHESLVEQTRTETQRVNVSFGNGSVSWDPGAVKFGSGVFIGGVPVNPSTQMPIPHPSQKVERIIWVDFKFDGINESALALLQQSLKGVSKIASDTYRWI